MTHYFTSFRMDTLGDIMSDFISYVVISEKAGELLQVLSLFFAKEGQRILPCRIILSQSVYLHVEVAVRDNPNVRGEFLIPHHAVVAVATNATDINLGFVLAGTDHK